MKTMTVMQISKSQRKQTQEVEKTMMKQEDQGELGCEDEGAEDDDNGKADGCYESGDDDDDDDGLHRPVCRLV